MAATIAAAFFYGTCYTPVKKHEVYDGLVFQWFQCSGIMISGLLFAMCTNDWDAGRDSPLQPRGFYVAYEGVISGIVFQVAISLSNLAVKRVGLGAYFSFHEITNLMGSFVAGTIGADLGVPTEAPRKIGVAILGITFATVGVLPIMFMKPNPSSESEPELGAHEEGVGGSLQPVTSPSPEKDDAQAAAAPYPPPPLGRSATSPTSSLAPSSEGGEPRARSWRPAEEPGGVQIRRSMSYNFGDKVVRERGARAFLKASYDPFGQVEQVESPVALATTEAGNVQAALLTTSSLRPETDSGWSRGVLLCLGIGILLSNWLTPFLYWKKRLQVDGFGSSGCVFSICVGIYFASSGTLISLASWKRYVTGERLQRPVLRPAMLSGALWTMGLLCQLYSLASMPYAISYAMTVGGTLMFNSVWSIVVFGEVQGRHNRRCAQLTLVLTLIGILLLAFSK